jgi:hypothetical protein
MNENEYKTDSLILGNGNIIPKISKKEGLDGVFVVFYILQGEPAGCVVEIKEDQKMTLLPNMFNGFYFKNKKSVEVMEGWLSEVKKYFKEGNNEIK